MSSEESPSSGSPSSKKPPADGIDRAGYWRANMTLIGCLLAVWATVSFGCSILFVEQLNQFSFGNLPLGFWFGQQGSIYVFVVLIFVYAIAMDKIDHKFNVKE